MADTDVDDAAGDDRAAEAAASAEKDAGVAVKARNAGRDRDSDVKVRDGRSAPGGDGWWLQRLVQSFVRFLREIVAELRKVIWPSRQELITYTSVVIVFVVILVAIVSGLDFGFAKLTLWMFG